MKRRALQAPGPNLPAKGPRAAALSPAVARYTALSSHLRRVFGCPVRRVALDAGATCPNRAADGSGGCSYCDALGAGTGRFAAGLSLAEQWARSPACNPAEVRLAYLQSFSNTHGPLRRLATLLDELLALPGLAGICLATRPDCLDAAKLDLLARAADRVPEFWLDMGLQSANDATLRRIGRGHDVACFATAVHEAARRGLQVCAHLMAGLPGEEDADFLASVDVVNRLPVAGVKLHNLLVVRGAGLAADYLAGTYHPLERGTYIELVVQALERLRPDIVIHRLQADAQPGELLAPQWAMDKDGIIGEIRRVLEARDTWQGRVWAEKSGEGQGTSSLAFPQTPIPSRMRAREGQE